MVETMRKPINNEKQAAKEGENPLMTDEEIREANNLYGRKDSKENPLLGNDLDRLKKLSEKRQEKINKIIPSNLSYESIAGLKGDKIASEQRELAINYFNKIITLNKEDPIAFQKQAIYYEKLINWDNDPRNLISSYEAIYNKKKSAFDILTENIFDNRNSICLVKKEKWDRLRDKTDEISAEEMKTYKNEIWKERLVIMYKIPDYYIEAVIWMPSLVNEALSRVEKLYQIKSSKRAALNESLSTRKGRVDLFDVAKKNWDKKFTNRPLPNTSLTPTYG
ncbi:hypothetical protein KJ980_00315 [Patescibacteria group bacterium]|nr:hypothetical protein [Patescibacteria group bacterium]MBU4017143.1 hypothetical protein [Patescibacteria group bacterium]MBU4098071.1 hypothetical protein [Patescibacteria group bacterium]